jgi:hypothetical protein
MVLIPRRPSLGQTSGSIVPSQPTKVPVKATLATTEPSPDKFQVRHRPHQESSSKRCFSGSSELILLKRYKGLQHSEQTKPGPEGAQAPAAAAAAAQNPGPSRGRARSLGCQQDIVQKGGPEGGWVCSKHYSTFESVQGGDECTPEQSLHSNTLQTLLSNPGPLLNTLSLLLLLSSFSLRISVTGKAYYWKCGSVFHLADYAPLPKDGTIIKGSSMFQEA